MSTPSVRYCNVSADSSAVSHGSSVLGSSWRVSRNSAPKALTAVNRKNAVRSLMAENSFLVGSQLPRPAGCGGDRELKASGDTRQQKGGRQQIRLREEGRALQFPQQAAPGRQRFGDVQSQHSESGLR